MTNDTQAKLREAAEAAIAHTSEDCDAIERGLRLLIDPPHPQVGGVALLAMTLLELLREISAKRDALTEENARLRGALEQCDTYWKACAEVWDAIAIVSGSGRLNELANNASAAILGALAPTETTAEPDGAHIEGHGREGDDRAS